MKNPLTALGYAWVAHIERNTECLVRDRNRFIWLAIRDVIMMILVGAATLLLIPVGLDWWHTLLVIFVCSWIGMHAFGNVYRATAYRAGWLDGRLQMVTALQEAAERGMSPHEWLDAELTRDLHTMGIRREDFERAVDEGDPDWGRP